MEGCVPCACKCGRTLLSIISDILDFSKIEARRLSLEKTDFNLNTPLREAAEMLAVEAHRKGLELTCEVGPDVPVLLQEDPNRLRQVLVNLLANAIKFTSKASFCGFLKRSGSRFLNSM